MALTLKIFGVVSRFLYSGGWQVCCYDIIGYLTQSVVEQIYPFIHKDGEKKMYESCRRSRKPHQFGTD